MDENRRHELKVTSRGVESCRRLRRERRHACSSCGYRHHCFSQGTPSLSPSISTPGQLSRKKVASGQDAICEQCRLPPRLNRSVLACCGCAAGADDGCGAVENFSQELPDW